MKKVVVLFLILILLLNISACNKSNKIVEDFSPMDLFEYYSNDAILYHEISHNENGYSYNTLTKTNDEISEVLKHYASLIGEHLSGFTGDSLKLSGEYINDGTFFKFESFKEETYVYTFIEIPLNSNTEIDKLIEDNWNKSIIPKVNDFEKNISKALKDNNQIIYTYSTDNISNSYDYYIGKCEDKDEYKILDKKISYTQKEKEIEIEFDFDNNLLIISQT